MKPVALLFVLALAAAADDKTLTIYVSPEHPYSIAYDRSVWTPGEGEGIDLALTHRSGDVVAAVFALTGETTLDQLRAIALKNGKATAPDLEVVAEARTKKDGAEILTMHMTGTNASFRGVYWAGDGRSVQLVAYTTKETDADVRALLDGLTIRVPKKRAFTMDYAPLKWRVTDDGSKDGAMLFKHSAGDTIGMAEATRADIPKGGLRAYVLEQAKAIAPRVRVVSEEQKTVHGANVTVLHLEGTMTNGVEAVFYGYFFSGAGAYVQALTVTPVQRFQERKADMTEFLDGLQIHIGRE